MSPSIALQLYSLREQLAQDFAGVIRRVADIGYRGVETAGFPGISVEQAARLFRELGLQTPSAHLPLPLGDEAAAALETAAQLGVQWVVCGMPPEDFSDGDRIRRVCERLNQADAVVRAHGYTLLYHNHWWEFQAMADGRYPYQIMLEALEPTVQFEIDTYWVRTAGHDPASVLAEFAGRAPLLHIKDGPATVDAPMTAVGQGVIDWTTVHERHTAEWWIVELDRCATDMFEAVAASYRYLTDKGYAAGRDH